MSWPRCLSESQCSVANAATQWPTQEVHCRGVVFGSFIKAAKWISLLDSSQNLSFSWKISPAAKIKHFYNNDQTHLAKCNILHPISCTWFMCHITADSPLIPMMLSSHRLAWVLVCVHNVWVWPWIERWFYSKNQFVCSIIEYCDICFLLPVFSLISWIIIHASIMDSDSTIFKA